MRPPPPSTREHCSTGQTTGHITGQITDQITCQTPPTDAPEFVQSAGCAYIVSQLTHRKPSTWGEEGAGIIWPLSLPSSPTPETLPHSHTLNPRAYIVCPLPPSTRECCNSSFETAWYTCAVIFVGLGNVITACRRCLNCYTFPLCD